MGEKREGRDCPCCYAARVAGMVGVMCSVHRSEGRERGPNEMALRLGFADAALSILAAMGGEWQLCAAHAGGVADELPDELPDFRAYRTAQKAASASRPFIDWPVCECGHDQNKHDRMRAGERGHCSACECGGYRKAVRNG